MSMTDTYSGARQTTQTQLFDAINSQRRFPINDKLYELVSGEAKFLNLLRKISKVSVGDHDNSFIEDRAPWLNTQKGYWYTGGTDFTASHMGASVDILVTTATNSTAAYAALKVGDIVQVVDADDQTKTANLLLKSLSTSTWTCYLLTEAPGFTPTVLDKVYHVGTAFGENGAFTTGEYTKPQTRWFSCQIFKDQVSFSRRIQNNKRIIYGNEADRLLRNGLAFHNVKMDRALLHGTARQTVTYATGTTNPFLAPLNEMVDAAGNYIGTSASFKQVMEATTNRDVSLETRVFNVTKASVEYGDMIDNFEQQFLYGSDVKEAICGRGVVSFFNKMAMKDNQYQLKAGENAYGIKVMKLITPHGEINLHPSRGMYEAGYNYAMAVIDPANIALAEFDATSWYGLPMTKDGKDIEILTDAGLWVRMPETHGWWWFV